MTYMPFSRLALCVGAAIALAACGGTDPEAGSSEPSVQSTPSLETSETSAPQPTVAAETQPASSDGAESSTPTTDVDVALEAALKRGRIVWFKCRSCHEVDAGRPHKVGPNLHGMFDMPAASKEGFSYSDALTNSGIIWNDETLDGFIKKPSTYVSGTKMAFVGIAKESDRQALIEYLRVETAPK